MGGNALKNYGVKRVDKATYVRIRDAVLVQLQPIVNHAKVPYSIENKADFGDVDILAVLKPEFTAQLREWLTATFSPRALLHNGNVWSFNVEDLQIDLITTSEEKWELYFTFLCWGDLSMTMGRVARLWDLKYGIDGLEMPIRDPETNHVVATILISRNPRTIFEFMGYSYDRWLQGFTDPEVLRQFLFSSPRIHRGFLDADSENTKHRKRDKGTRVLYSVWYAWFQEHRNEFPERADLPIPQGLDAKIAYVEAAFPESNLRAEVNRVQQEIADSMAARKKFSGSHIQALFPDLQGRAFGALMDLWTKQWPNKDEQIRYVLDHDIAHLTELAHKVRKGLVLNAN